MERKYFLEILVQLLLLIAYCVVCVMLLDVKDAKTLTYYIMSTFAVCYCIRIMSNSFVEWLCKPKQDKEEL